MLLLPKETETANKISGSEDATATTETTEVEVSTVVNSDNLNSLDQEQQQQSSIANVPSSDLPKFDQYILDSITAAASSSSTSITSSSMGCQNFCANGASNSQNTNNDPHEMPQLLNILNELLDGQDLTSLANSGGNGDNMQDMVDQVEENYEEESPRKDDPEEIARVFAQQRLDEISKEEQQLRRRMDFMIRRLYKLVSRSTGLHVSEELSGFLEHVARYSKKKDKTQTSSSSTTTTTATKFPYLNLNHQGTSSSELLLKSPDFPTEPPLNLLSSPSTSQDQQNDDDVIEPLPTENLSNNNDTTLTTLHNNNNNNNSNQIATTKDVIEPTTIIDALKPVPMKEMKSFLRRIDNISTMQSTVMTKKALAFKYFSPSSLASNLNQTSNFNVSAIPKLDDRDVDKVEETSGLLMSEMRLIEKQIDSDATASSTGGESADEMIVYNNNYQYPLSISKRAAYKYAKDRGAIASRWCWLATQISELDYKIRQHTDLKKHLRESKGIVALEAVETQQQQQQLEGHQIRGSTSAYNVDSDSEDCLVSAARVRPFIKNTFRKRKLVHITNLHQVSKKAARPSSLKCGCNWPLPPCALCTARLDPTAPRECTDVLPETERVALLDPGFHPVLSFPEDVSSSIHLEAIMNIPEWQAKMIRSSPKSIMKHATKQLDLLGGGNGSFKDELKMFGLARSFDTDKKNRKGNIDAITGKRKYTKRFLKIDGQLAGKLKEKKKYKKKQASLAMVQDSHVPRKYTFKKRIRKLEGFPNSPYNQQFINGLNGTDKQFDMFNRSKNSSPIPGNKMEKSSADSRRTRNYDIDNIVIPYSVAAATRIELLSYKEIPTPKWKIITDDEEEEQLLVEKEQFSSTGVPNEDITDDSITVIHEKALLDERKKFETYLKFPLTSRSRANRRIDSRGNESSGANTPTPDQTSPAPVHGDLDTSIPSPLDNSVFQETPSITALFNNVNGRKERKRTTSKKDEVHDGGGGYISSGINSRAISPEIIKEIIPAYEPLNFPLSDVSFHRMKRVMPPERSRSSDKYVKTLEETGTSHLNHNSMQQASSNVMLKQSKPIKRRKHNDSISESILIKEKLPSSSLTTIGKNNNLLIPRNNHTILNSIDLKGTDGAALKKLMNNNNGDLTNGEGFNDDDDDDDDEMDDNSDSETVTGEESLFEPDDEETESEEEEEDDYLDDEVDYDPRIVNNKKKNIATIMD